MILIFGSILAAMTYYSRMKMPETARYTSLVAKNVKQATQDMSKVLQVEIQFVVMYAFTFFFANFGPKNTTFIVPAEIFPARLRSTCHRISAAAGKVRAIVGSFGFLYASQSKDKTKTDKGYTAGIGMRNSLFVLTVSTFLSLLCTLLVPESKGKSLEEMSSENEEEMQESVQAVDNGRALVGGIEA
ncbi:Inorganic phosphate transporter 1-4 [Platanthera guangdongensis]|uniref:H(+)/Pi cotransporter n=1 Tax=Platanthera guangdongensis TaxID=2320717 RepID=A0ABR2N0Z0_9ASPA